MYFCITLFLYQKLLYNMHSRKNVIAHAHTYRTSTLPTRSKGRSSTRNSTSYSPETIRKNYGNSLDRHSGHRVGHSSISSETLNSAAPHFGFFPKPETRPGAITPAYVTPRVYRSARNLTRDHQHSGQNSEREDKKRNSSISKPFFKSESHINSSTLPRMQIARNQSHDSKDLLRDIKNRCKFATLTFTLFF